MTRERRADRETAEERCEGDARGDEFEVSRAVGVGMIVMRVWAAVARPYVVVGDEGTVCAEGELRVKEELLEDISPARACGMVGRSAQSKGNASLTVDMIPEEEVALAFLFHAFFDLARIVKPIQFGLGRSETQVRWW